MIRINPKNPKKPQPNPEMGSARMKARSFLQHLNEFHSHIDRIVAAVFNRQAFLFSSIWHGG